ncbi:MAG: hypothetical protein RIC89_09195 [Pseudomonadales bacterium]
MKILISLATSTLLAVCAASYGATIDPIECLVCDKFDLQIVEVKPTLNAVTPDPLPRKEVGESQDVTVNWTLPRTTGTMLKQRFSLCVTGSDPAVRLRDGCAQLQNTTTLATGKEGYTYQSTVTLPGTFQRFSAYFYIRMQPVIIIGNGGFTASNLVPFNWPLHIAELEARSVKVDIGLGGIVTAEQRVTNRGTRASAPFQNRYQMTICSQIIDPARTCHLSSPEYLDALVVFAQSSGIAPGVTENLAVDISSMLSATPATLTITIRGDVDYYNEVREEDEFNNFDSGTDTLYR